MTRIAASMLALAIGFCFTFAVGCSDKKTTPTPGAKDFALENTSDAAFDLKQGESKVVKVKNGDIKDATSADTKKVSAIPESDGKAVKISALDNAEPGKVKVTIKSKEGDKTATIDVNVIKK